MTDPFLAVATTGGSSSGSVAALLIYILVALSISFLCSILEAVLLSTSLSHIELSANRGERAGRLMRKHKQDVDRPIAAILTLNTIAHTVGAAGAGAQAAAIFGDQWIGIISAILTLLILIFSEIIPKTLGAVYWKQLMPISAFVIEGLVRSLIVAVWASKRLTKILEPGEREPTVTRSELEVLAQVGIVEGALPEKESRILRNVFRLRDIPVESIMTPRTVIFAVQQDMTIGEVMDEHPNLPYSRIPIYESTIDNIGGFVLRYDLLKAAAEDKDDMPIHTISRPVDYVPESLSVVEALEAFMSRQEHLLIVLDEFSGTSGLITLEDAIESLLGVEIVDESDEVEDMQALARQRNALNTIASGNGHGTSELLLQQPDRLGED